MKLNEIILGDCLEKMKELPDNSVDSIVTDPPYGLSFMGSKWDYDIPSVEIWMEVFRVIKPGGHLLAACGTRTQHRMSCNIEDAGFEIRDVISWVYASGFPKSLNVGKKIDEIQGNERQVIGINNNKINLANLGDAGYKGSWEVTKGNSVFEGWGTAIKPACEFFTLARKPLSESTITKNVLKWGTGAINIDGCRIGLSGGRNNGSKADKNGYSSSKIYGKYTAIGKRDYNMGRFPANFIHDGSDEVLDCFPESKSSDFQPAANRTKIDNFFSGLGNDKKAPANYADKGNASRVFYCAKASRAERDEGLGFLPLKNNMRVNAPRQNEAEKVSENSRNIHPTVKPIALMRYLCRLITPPNGIILEPFAGSGTTCIAAMVEGFRFIAFEREPEYYAIALARINYWKDRLDLLNEEDEIEKPQKNQLKLF